jgi:hypothetical protein
MPNQVHGREVQSHGSNDKPAVARSIQVCHNKPNDFVEFNSVVFDVQDSVTNGFYLANAVATSDISRETHCINCRTAKKLDYFATASRSGTMVFDGGQIGGKISAIRIENGSGIDATTGLPYITAANIKNPDRWTSNLISIGAVGGQFELRCMGPSMLKKLPPLRTRPQDQTPK